ncbi:MAG: dTDP-4-dehydrorhamnose 3,5-epimerase [Gammaproteobacteria bacterium]|nr:MAG: dTDP-4-dehydrorhamnose 3,5-epimerase [Gammaproteobacteria bacterium]
MDIITTNIEGVKIAPLGRIPDERGTILHGVRADNMLSKFGEVYFKKLYQGVINGWHMHEKLVLNYICVHGMIKLVLYDMREKSPTYRQLQEFFIGDDNYCLVHIPPGVANGSKGMAAPFSIMCNVASEPHDPSLKYLRIDPHSGEIPYNWTRRDY